MQKTTLIVGGAKGIGEAAAKRQLKNNDRVYILDIQKPTLEGVEFVQCDVCDPLSIEKAIETVAESEKHIDGLVYSAGVFFSGTIEETSFETLQKVLSVNFTGCFLVLKAVLPLMKTGQSASVVIVGSDQSFVGKPHSAIYGATKGALGQLTKSTALDCAAFNIRVNCVCPGTIDTDFYRDAITRYSKKSGIPLSEIEKDEAACQPLNRVGKPEEVAALISFLLSDKSCFMTGGLYPVDGGYIAR